MKKEGTMKHTLLALTCAFLLTACGMNMQSNRESRSTAYIGQTTWDMYENFGVPARALFLSEDEVLFYYHRAEITRDWTQMQYDYCDMVFRTINGYVVEWDYVGNSCTVHEGYPAERFDSADLYY